MSLTKLSLAVNDLIVPGQGEIGYSDIMAGDGKISIHFYRVGYLHGTTALCKAHEFILQFNLANRTYLRGIEQGSDVVAPSLLLFSLLLPAVC
jgi:hypothetical protein